MAPKKYQKKTGATKKPKITTACGFEQQPLNDDPTQKMLQVNAVESVIRRGGHHCYTAQTSPMVTMPSIEIDVPLQATPAFARIVLAFSRRRSAGCTAHHAVGDKLLPDWPDDWKKQYERNQAIGLIGPNPWVHQRLDELDREEKAREAQRAEQEAIRAEEASQMEELVENLEDLSVAGDAAMLAKAMKELDDMKKREADQIRAAARADVAGPDANEAGGGVKEMLEVVVVVLRMGQDVLMPTKFVVTQVERKVLNLARSSDQRVKQSLLEAKAELKVYVWAYMGVS
ncbi:hypothetical protein OHC33_010673 [Knufia fluminis]|uniref:Uncharacterized protein n=1 Tax=Knufia fluminis TaxID=191047 RepID=A0AAN8I185_9EURO|nr:hypothetical protein OHC33_010673 [Knufia fluminis]